MISNKLKFSIPIAKIYKETLSKIDENDETATERYIIKKKGNNLDTVNNVKVEENENNFQNINLNKAREDYEKKTQEKMKEIKGDYTESEKRDLALINLKTTTHYIDIDLFNFDKIDIELIKKQGETERIKKMNEINSENNIDEKLSVLNEMNIKKCYIDKEEIKQSQEKKLKNKLSILNENSKNLDVHSCINITENSTFQDSSTEKSQPPGTDTKEPKVKTFNEARIRYHLKYKLFDNLLTYVEQYSTLPERYEIDNTHYVFIYEDDLKTFPITSNERIYKNKEIIKTNILNEPFGLYFCRKKIKFEGEIEIRECAPNNFICKECMEKNKKRFNLPDDCLININGRVSKDIKGKYYCFGTFKIGYKIINCLNSFTCKACEILNLYKNYYFEKSPKNE